MAIEPTRVDKHLNLVLNSDDKLIDNIRVIVGAKFSNSKFSWI